MTSIVSELKMKVSKKSTNAAIFNFGSACKGHLENVNTTLVWGYISLMGWLGVRMRPGGAFTGGDPLKWHRIAIYSYITIPSI